jgi:hypothetical protein
MGIGTFIGGGILGAIAYRNLDPARKDSSNLKIELDQAKKELESYKANVNSHFDKTSELVNELTQDYVKVYKHLAEGAQELGDGREFAHVLEQHQGKVLISVDSEPTTQGDDILSEVKAHSQGPRPAEGESVDAVVTQGTISEGDADISADSSEHSEPSVQDDIVTKIKAHSQGPRPAEGEPLDAVVTQGTVAEGDAGKAAGSKVGQSANASNHREPSVQGDIVTKVNPQSQGPRPAEGEPRDAVVTQGTIAEGDADIAAGSKLGQSGDAAENSEPSVQDDIVTKVKAHAQGPRPAEEEPADAVVTQGTIPAGDAVKSTDSKAK